MSVLPGTSLPDWVTRALDAHSVRIVRFGRDKRGRPSKKATDFIAFCGWFYWRQLGKDVVSEHVGPFPTPSAAADHAATHYGIAVRNQDGKLEPTRLGERLARGIRAAA